MCCGHVEFSVPETSQGRCGLGSCTIDAEPTPRLGAGRVSVVVDVVGGQYRVRGGREWGLEVLQQAGPAASSVILMLTSKLPVIHLEQGSFK